eukprot:1821848-Rhodomonas_salina.2
MPGTDLVYGATRRARATWSLAGFTTRSAIVLRACYSLPSTDLAYGTTVLRACYAMSDTDVAYGATRNSVGEAYHLPVVWYAPGQPRYPPTRVVPAVRY